MKNELKKRLIFLVFFLCTVSCSAIKKTVDSGQSLFIDEGNPDAFVSKIDSKWFVSAGAFALKKTSGEVVRHMLYDVSPDINSDNFTLNFVVATPEGSSYGYSIDLLSGQHYFNKKFCKQSDVWKKYSETVYKPPYTQGIVPRILDQLGSPQKIIVFGDKDYYSENFTKNFFDAKIIGAIIEQVCPLGRCHQDKDWNSRIVLIGVQVGNDDYKDVNNLEDIKKKLDWTYVEAFVENGQGRNFLAGSYSPGFKYGAELTAQQSLRYLDRNSIYLKNEKLLGIRKSCHLLYNHIWNEVGLDSKYESKIKKIKTREQRKNFISKNKLNEKTLFYTRFKRGFSKYANEYKTCSKYIYTSSVNDHIERHWFFTYYSAVHKLYELGHTFSCSRVIWKKSHLSSLDRGEKAIETAFRGCSARKIDIAFESAVTYLAHLGRKKMQTYKYIDYDKGLEGTHRKLYSWVPFSNKVFQCEDNQGSLRRKRKDLFPRDVKWIKRRLNIGRDGTYIR